MAIKVTIVANCQGAPLAEILKLFFGFEVALVVVAHRPDLIKDQAIDAAAQRSDFILTQHISDAFPAPAIRTVTLKERWPDKLVLWQNLYFKGYNPELIYIRAERGRPCRGPLGDYHIADIADGHRNGRDAAAVASDMRDPEVNHARYGAELEATLANLRGREEATVTPVSGFIAEHFRTRRLFYTFNHPTNLLLFRVATLIAKSLGARSLQRFRPDLINEKLGDIILPTNPAVRPGMEGTVSDWTNYVGLRYLLTGTGVVVQHREGRFYGLDDLVQHFYRVYDAMEASAPQRVSAV